jgi:hypothetical protein
VIRVEAPELQIVAGALWLDLQASLAAKSWHAGRSRSRAALG